APRQAEHFARRGQVAEHDAIECDDRDQVRLSAARWSWLESCDHRLFSHWRILPRFVGWRYGGSLMHPAPLAVMDYVGPAVGALLFVAAMSLVAEPTRRTLNAIILAGASGVYLSGGFGLWELTYPVIGAAIGFRALRSYRWIGVGWLIHACWDIAHHLWGNPIWPFMPSSAFGCMIFDSMIAPWFLAGAPSFLKRPLAAMRAVGARTTTTPTLSRVPRARLGDRPTSARRPGQDTAPVPNRSGCTP